MRYSNLHTHTVFSDGMHTMEENIASAMEKNMLSLGFSDHSYTPCDESYCMRPGDYHRYRNTLEHLKKGSPLPIYAGLELDACSDGDLSPYDYIIASAHYLRVGGVSYSVDETVEIQQRCVQDGFGGNALDMVRCYCDTLGEHVARVRPTLVGHFDVISKFGFMPETDDRYRAIMADCLKEVLKICPYIELNTGAIAKGWKKEPYPAEYLFDTIKGNDGRIVLSSDCHHRDHLTFWFDEAVALLKERGVSSISVFHGTGFSDMPI